MNFTIDHLARYIVEAIDRAFNLLPDKNGIGYNLSNGKDFIAHIEFVNNSNNERNTFDEAQKSPAKYSVVISKTAANQKQFQDDAVKLESYLIRIFNMAKEYIRKLNDLGFESIVWKDQDQDPSKEIKTVEKK